MLRTVSWVLLGLVATLVLFGSLTSAWLAYVGDPSMDVFGEGGPSVQDVSAWRADVATGVRARRGTAAAYASAYAVLFLVIALVPYRRGDVWAWWALLGGALTVAVLTWLRVPLLHTRLGASAGAGLLGVTALGLLLDAGRLRSARPGPDRVSAEVVS
jgi:hypothetical protein